MTTEDRAYLPSNWEDQKKMLSLYAPFRTTEVNPDGFKSKISFWKDCIERYSQVTYSTIFTVSELKKSFVRNGKFPDFETVLNNMIRSGDIIELKDFLNMKPVGTSEPWSSWLISIGKAPMYWAWNRMKNTVYKVSDADIKYVHMGILQEQGEDVLKKASDARGEVTSVTSLMQKVNWPESKTESFLIVLFWLHCQNKAALFNFDLTSPSKTLVKLTSNENGDNKTISEVDVCKYELLQLTKKLEYKIAEYEKKCEQAREEARACMAKNSKVLALSQLKKKQLFEKIIEREANKLLNIHSLLETLQETESNKEVMIALKVTNAAIKQTQKENNMSGETVSDIMDEIRETVETHEDINAALSQSMTDIADEDIAQELALLEKDIAVEDDLCKWVENLRLPDVPESPEKEKEIQSKATQPTASVE